MMAGTISLPKSPSPTSGAHSSILGDAFQITLLLSDWKNFGLAERVGYHWDLLEKAKTNNELIAKELEEGQATYSSVCGVLSLLECVLVVPWKELGKYQRRVLRNSVREFNLQAQHARINPQKPYHRPPNLPVRLTTSTRVSYTYEMTRIALILDASPTLVSAFGVSAIDEHICAMDRFPGMVQKFFAALSEPIPTSLITRDKAEDWRSTLAVTVLAVYPHGGKKDENNTSILVRDFRINNKQDANILVEKVREWALSHVESNIAHRLNSAGVGLLGYQSWATHKYTSSLRDILDAGDVALDFLPSKARPCIVLATDCRSVSCEEILHLFTYEERLDVPIHILDLSSMSHRRFHQDSLTKQNDSTLALMAFGATEPSAFPLHMSDDSESLFSIARATGGSFFTEELLNIASNTTVGQVPSESLLAADHYLSIKRRAFRPNAVQWYVLCCISSLTQSMGRAIRSSTGYPAGYLVPPEYILHRMNFSRPFRRDLSTQESADNRSISITSVSAGLGSPEVTTSTKNLEIRQSLQRATFSTYVVNPVHIKGLLVARIKEGYRPERLRTPSQDSELTSIQLALTIEQGTTIHYELQYKASSNPLIGVAHVKVEVSGYPDLLQKMKAEFSAYTSGRYKNASTIVKVVCVWLRREDLQLSFLCPVVWGDKVLSESSPIVRRLGSLSSLQLMRNFRVDRFDILCTGNSPFAHQEHVPWSEMMKTNGEQEFFDALANWSTRVIDDKRKYVKPIFASNSLTAYCIVEVSQSPIASRLFRISVNTIGGCDLIYRLQVVADLKGLLYQLRDVTVLVKSMYDCLVGVPVSYHKASHHAWRNHFLVNHFDREEWRPVRDPELMDLLIRRRIEIDKFRLLHLTDNFAFFAKDVSVETGKSTENPIDDVHLVEYQIELRGEDQLPVISMYVEKDVGTFATDVEKGVNEKLTLASRLFMRVKRRDQECSVALRSRTKLLALFSGSRMQHSSEHQLKEDVERLLAYSYGNSRPLRFFRDFPEANIELERQTVKLILSSHSKGDIVKLNIDPLIFVGGQGQGHWFLAKFDHQTLSFMHLPLTEKLQGEGALAYVSRELNFFTFGISDLYCIRNESIPDDEESSQGHMNEYWAVERFANCLETVHKENYAEAAYLALRNAPQITATFSKADFDLVMEMCQFKKGPEVVINPEGLSVDVAAQQSKLMRTILTLFTPVPGHEWFMFYSGKTCDILEPENDKLDITVEESDGDNSLDDELSSEFSEGNDDRNEATSSSRGLGNKVYQSLAPVFVKFTLDGKDIHHHNLSFIKHEASLAVHMSVFKSMNTGKIKAIDFPQLHTVISCEVEGALISYVAEQKLERMRAYGDSITDAELKEVRRCLRKARNVSISVKEINFYIAKLDKIIHASNQAGCESEIKSSFKLLFQELHDNSFMKIRLTKNDSYCVVEEAEEGFGLKHWSFITIQQSLGIITYEVYHPDGIVEATNILTSLQRFVDSICHRTNQLLLLQKLHRTRSASSYLLPAQPLKITEGPFQDGHFACPVVFEEHFELYYLCSTVKVMASLSSTLHSFAVSNRGFTFVYIDEEMCIFYFSLAAKESDSNTDPKQINLLVHGVQNPGASVKVQLTRLLRKKIMLLAVEAWSTVLNKNPRRNWKKADVEFLQNFQYHWSKDENETSPNYDGKNEINFKLPPLVNDPLIILMYFRQNICGSTYFHRLNEIDGSDASDESSMIKDEFESVNKVGFDRNEFVFFYNNSPSPLDPNYQNLSTLTPKGKDLSEQTGTGIAIIQLSLRSLDNTVIDALNIGVSPDPSTTRLDVPLPMLRVKEVGLPFTEADGSGNFLVHLRIIDTFQTPQNREALKQWITLTLNQVVAAWTIERHIQKTQTKLVNSSITSTCIFQDTTKKRLVEIDKLIPGLPELIDMFQLSYILPHPAVQCVEFHESIISTSVASHTIDMLTKGILVHLVTGQDTPSSVSMLLREIITIRSSNKDYPEITTFMESVESPESDQQYEIRVNDKKFVRDSPIESPEYLCYFCVESYSGKKRSNEEYPMLFSEVMIGDVGSDKRKSSFSQRLLEIKQTSPSTFLRSFAFVLSVQRNKRSLIMYNWDPRLVSKVIASLKGLETQKVSKTEMMLRSSQCRCLGDLAPFALKSVEALGRRSHNDRVEVAKIQFDNGRTQQNSLALTAPAPQGPQKRIRRPTSIRRPKLVGKSVEGAAMQAVAASRAKARATNVGPTRPSPAGKIKVDVVGDVSMQSQKPEQINEESEDTFQFKKLFTESFGLPWSSGFGLTRFSYDILQHFWFQPGKSSILNVTRDTILNQTTYLWTISTNILPSASALSNDLVLEFSQEMEREMKSIGTCRIISTCGSTVDETMTVYFMTVVKMSSMVVFLVFRIASRKSNSSRKQDVLTCDVWMMKLLHPNSEKQHVKRRSRKLIEKESAFLANKCGKVQQLKTCLDAKFLDYSLRLIEKSVLQLQGALDAEYFRLAEDIIEKYSFDDQQEMPDLKYRAFSANIILKSYEDNLIDKFDALSLFKHLYNVQDNFQFKAGPNAILLAQHMKVQETTSFCFLRKLHENKTTMKIIFVCRVEGQNLDKQVFPEGVNVSSSLFKLIVVEGARLAYRMLRDGASRMYTNSLWEKAINAYNFISPQSMEEIFSLTFSKDIFVENDVTQLLKDEQLAIDPEDLFVKMSRDTAYLPTRKIRTHSHGYHILFYHRKIDVFIVFNLMKGKITELKLVCRDEISDEILQTFVESFSQYITFYLWKS